jgi:quercetin dioxygenase-like cupin family protein
MAGLARTEGTMTIPQTGGYVLGSTEGEGYWFLGAHLLLKVTGAQSAGGMTVVETRQPRGHGSSLHVHSHDDEVFYVLDGAINLQVGDDVHRLTQGMLGFGPRGVQHNFIVTSEQARLLVMTTPSGLENLVRAAGEPASEAVIPESMAPPDRAVFLAQNAERGIEILGPPMTLD